MPSMLDQSDPSADGARFTTVTSIEDDSAVFLRNHPDDVTLASGISGLLILQASLHRSNPSQASAKRIERSIAKVLDGIERLPMHVSLWSGLAGTLYALEYARSINEELLPDGALDFVAEMDDLIEQFVIDRPMDIGFDIISGLSGIGAYAIMRTDDAAAQRLFAAVEDSLMKLSVSDANGRTWKTLPKHVGPMASGEAKASGHHDLGIAHGIPGVLGILSGGIKWGLARDSTRDCVAEGLRWLLHFERQKDSPSLFPNYDSSESPSRVAWCYGDLGIALAFVHGGEALGSEEFIQFGLSMAHRRLSMHPSTFMITDLGLCHGFLGVRHIVMKLNRRRHTEFLCRVGDSMLNQAAEAGYPRTNWSFLDGSIGALLALQCEAEMGRRAWDVCYSLGF
jgi:lantibiotic biosynthesis protein